MKWKIWKVIGMAWLLSSCIVQSPKYTTLDNVMSLQIGMSRDEVEKKLGLKPYDLKAYTDTSYVFIYVYRVIERKTLSIDTRTTNGVKVKGKYVQLAVGYAKNSDKVISIESCSLCPDNLVTYSTIDIEKIILFITVTLPVILVYLGLRR